jgi:outer membrane lipoprotein
MMIFIPIIIPGGGTPIGIIAIGTIEALSMINAKEGDMNLVKRFIIATALCQTLILTACAGGISKETRSQITYFGSFREVQQAPQKYRGETVMWGGKVIQSRAKDNATELVVLQLGLGSGDRPKDDDQSQGRFLIRSDRFLDPAIYSQGTLITVVGPVKGAEVRTIGEMEYHYPVMDVTEIKKWKPGVDSPPRFHFGIGIGTYF